MNDNKHHLRMTDMTDREVLALLDDNTGEDGHASAGDMTNQLWPSSPEAVYAVSQRLSWMKRYGLVQRKEGPPPARWTLTELGEQLLAGRLQARQVSTLHGLDTVQRVLAIHEMTRDSVDVLMRRAWRYGEVRR